MYPNPFFVKNYYKTFSVEKSSPKVFASSLMSKKTNQRKQPPNKRKLAQSGHPGFYPRRIRGNSS
jgi:hypothetical protein